MISPLSPHYNTFLPLLGHRALILKLTVEFLFVKGFDAPTDRHIRGGCSMKKCKKGLHDYDGQRCPACKSAYLIQYVRERKATDPLFKLRNSIHSNTKDARHSRYSQASKIGDILGCDYLTFRSHLINTAIVNYGKYDRRQAYVLDHIVPLSSAKTAADLLILGHYTNIQLLTPEDNRAKASKLDWMPDKK